MVSEVSGFGRILMEVAKHQAGRKPVATAVLKSGKGNIAHIMEFADGESLTMMQDKTRPKSRFKAGHAVIEGASSFTSWASQLDAMDNIAADLVKQGFYLVKTRRIDAVQLPLVDIRDAKAA